MIRLKYWLITIYEERPQKGSFFIDGLLIFFGLFYNRS